MPIRTNRGRVAVYRRLWGWPIRSTKHLIITVVVLALLIIAFGFVIPRLTDSGSSSKPAAGAPSVMSSQPTVPVNPNAGQVTSTRLTAPLLTPTSAPPAPAAIAVAQAWAQAWVTHPDGMTNEAWRETLRPYTTEEFLPQLSTVELSNIPATRVTGGPTVVTSYTSSVEVIIPTDGPRLSITVVNTDQGWRVTEYDQAS